VATCWYYGFKTSQNSIEDWWLPVGTMALKLPIILSPIFNRILGGFKGIVPEGSHQSSIGFWEVLKP
jgi:hypothetical protein